MITTIKDVQNVQLDILKRITILLEEYHIPYSLAYGTFLGSIRHEGFIPWDDDIDIYVESRTFKKMKKAIMKKIDNDLFIQCLESDYLSPWIYYKVRKNNTYMHEDSLSEKYDKIHQGIWIDIFPLVYASNNILMLNLQLKLIYYSQLIKFYFVVEDNANCKYKTRIYNYIV